MVAKEFAVYQCRYEFLGKPHSIISVKCKVIWERVKGKSK